MYTKTCVICNKEFQSEARNKRYCSEHCCELGQKKNLKTQKARKKRQKAYAEDKDINRLIQRAYSLAMSIGDLLLEHKCSMCSDVCSGELQIHHRDVNPLNNSIENLQWLCKKHHAEVHSSLERINFCEELKKQAFAKSEK